MIGRYGQDFSSDFLEYANGAKKPNISTAVTNSPDITSKRLTDHGYRLAADPGGVPQWVHPSGHEYWLLQPSAPAPAPAPAPDQSGVLPDMDDPCAQMCLDQPDEVSCDQCCDDTIPDTDQPCRTKCHDGCFFAMFP
jgi:hypothetical protein